MYRNHLCQTQGAYYSLSHLLKVDDVMFFTIFPCVDLWDGESVQQVKDGTKAHMSLPYTLRRLGHYKLESASETGK